MKENIEKAIEELLQMMLLQDDDTAIRNYSQAILNLVDAREKIG